jgi:hypothetical protein
VAKLPLVSEAPSVNISVLRDDARVIVPARNVNNFLPSQRFKQNRLIGPSKAAGSELTVCVISPNIHLSLVAQCHTKVYPRGHLHNLIEAELYQLILTLSLSPNSFNTLVAIHKDPSLLIDKSNVVIGTGSRTNILQIYLHRRIIALFSLRFTGPNASKVILALLQTPHVGISALSDHTHVLVSATHMGHSFRELHFPRDEDV